MSECKHKQSDLKRMSDLDAISEENIKVRVWRCEACNVDIHFQGKDKDLVNGKPKLDA